MPNVTLFVTDNLKKRMDEHPDVSWSSTIRLMIEKKLDDFEETERLAKKSKLTPADLEHLSVKVRSDAVKLVEDLLHASRS